MEDRERERRRWRRVQWTLGTVGLLFIGLVLLWPVLREQQLVRTLKVAVPGFRFEAELAERQARLGQIYQQGLMVALRHIERREERAYQQGLKDGVAGCACE